MADINAGYLKVKLDLFKRWYPKYARKRIQHAFVDRIDKSVPLVTVWHHSAELLVVPSSDCLSYPQTNDIPLYSLPFLIVSFLSYQMCGIHEKTYLYALWLVHAQFLFNLLKLPFHVVNNVTGCITLLTCN